MYHNKFVFVLRRISIFQRQQAYGARSTDADRRRGDQRNIDPVRQQNHVDRGNQETLRGLNATRVFVVHARYDLPTIFIEHQPHILYR